MNYNEEVVNYNYAENGSASSEYDSAASGAPSTVRSEVAGSRSADPPPAPLQSRPKKQYAVSTRWEREVAANGLPRDFSSYFCCCAHRIGNMFILWERPDGSPLVIAGPCWPFCIGVTLPLIIGISAVASYFVFFSKNTSVVSHVGVVAAAKESAGCSFPFINALSTQPFWICYIYYSVLGLVLLCLFCVSCRDPGLMERITDEEAGNFRISKF